MPIDFQTDTWYSTTVSWNPQTPWIGSTANVFIFPPPVVTIQFKSLLDRDRFHLARARPIIAPLLSTPTTKAPVALTLTTRQKRSGHGSRWERSPLNKRALARR